LGVDSSDGDFAGTFKVSIEVRCLLELAPMTSAPKE
jgi:hypothetical protein